MISNTLDFYVDLIERSLPFKFVRFCDGQFVQIFNRRGIRQHRFHPEMREELIRVLREGPGEGEFFALQNRALNRFGEKIGEICQLTWHDGDVFHLAAIAGKLYPLIRLLKERKVAVVGPDWLSCFASGPHVHTQPKDCYEQIDHLRDEVESISGVDMIVFCCGSPSRILIHDLPLEDRILLDLGSLLDLFAGHPTRGYQKELSRETIQRNLTGQ